MVRCGSLLISVCFGALKNQIEIISLCGGVSDRNGREKKIDTCTMINGDFWACLTELQDINNENSRWSYFGNSYRTVKLVTESSRQRKFA